MVARKSKSRATKRPATRGARKAPAKKSVAKPAAKAAATGGTPPTSAAPVRLARVAKGRKPQYFSDPAIDRLLWMTITLMEELSVARERIDTIERLLDRKQLLRIREIEAYEPDAKADGEREARRAQYVDRVLRILQSELDEIEGKRVESEAVEAVGS